MKPLIDKLRNKLLVMHTGTDIATSLRGFAALGVVLVHWNGIGLRSNFEDFPIVNKLINNIIDLGAQGPTVFFISSGFVLHIQYRRNPNFEKFILRRFFRLAPLYLIANAICYLMQDNRQDLTMQLLIKKILFLDLFFKDARNFSPLIISFFVVNEFWLSFILILTLKIEKFKFSSQILILILSFFISYSYLSLSRTNNQIADFKLDILYFQFFFICGSFLAFPLWKNKFTMSNLSSLFMLIFILFVINLTIENYKGYLTFLISFLILAHANDLQNTFFTQSIYIYLGNICYSIYLLHIPIYNVNSASIESFFFLLVVCTITYLFIELPFIKLSKNFSN